MEQALLTITGRVQAVGYRYSAEIKAKEFGLKGYIRNLYDGSVEALVQGEKEKILQFIEWCKDGPRMAKVEKVQYQWQPITYQYKNFEID